jgi:acetyl esterase/lipase
MKHAAVIAVVLALSVPVFAQLPSPAPGISSELVTSDRFPPRDITFANGVTGIPGVVYWEQLGYRPLKLDLYLPGASTPRPQSGFPLVIYIHGGGWRSGNPRISGPIADFPGLLASLSARGYVVASVEYRFSREAGFPAQVRDVKTAIRWLRRHATSYGIDPARAVTWGVSAGGHLAGLTAVSCGAPALEPEPIKAGSYIKPDTSDAAGISDCVQGGVAWFGVFNISTIAAQAKEAKVIPHDDPESAEWQLLGCNPGECKAEQLAAASPVSYVDSSDPPMLLITGTEDLKVPCEQTMEMARKLKSAGVKHDVILLPGVTHSFVGKTPESTREANLKAIDATFRFIDRTIGTPPKQ